MSDSMIERAARAIYGTSPGGKSWDDAVTLSGASVTFDNKLTREIGMLRLVQCRAAARAATEALRNPSDHLLGIHDLMDVTKATEVRADWNRVIDSILAEKHP